MDPIQIMYFNSVLKWFFFSWLSLLCPSLWVSGLGGNQMERFREQSYAVQGKRHWSKYWVTCDVPHDSGRLQMLSESDRAEFAQVSYCCSTAVFFFIYMFKTSDHFTAYTVVSSFVQILFKFYFFEAVIIRWIKSKYLCLFL